jgi:cytosine/adenosine deaminase-related metal-dependent hydrolase
MKTRCCIASLLLPVLGAWAVTASADAGANPSAKLKVDDTKVIFCGALAPPPSGVCSVTPGDMSLLIRGNVLGFDTIYQGGEVVVDATGLIQYVGCGADRPMDLDVSTSTRIDCASGVISPGLINAHDHQYYDQNYPFADTGDRYDHRNDWRSSPAIHAPGDFDQEQVAWTELRQVMAGTTSIAGSGSEFGFLRNADAPYWSYPLYDDSLWNESAGESPVQIVTDTFPLENSWEYQQYTDCDDYTYLGRRKNFYTDVYVPHVAEGINTAAATEFDCLADVDDMVTGDFAMVHGLALTAHDGRMLAENRASLIWSPRSNVFLYGNTALAPMLKNQGVLLSLGTDWTPSGSLALGRELVCADELNHTYFNSAFSDRELWLMATLNPAIALHVADRIGRLQAGYFGDISIFDGHGFDNPYRAVIEADAASTALVLRRSSMPFPFLEGAPTYVGSIALSGDEPILASLPPTLHDFYAPFLGISEPLCEAIDVCGIPKMVCPLRETWYLDELIPDEPFLNPLTLTDLEADNADSYPLFFCGAPPDEPTCMPYREGEYNGIPVRGPASLSDWDGDGIVDNLDNCRKVFNPVRPMDGGIQADSDGDGRGDACDKCPLDPGPECTAVDPYTGEIVFITDGD